MNSIKIQRYDQTFICSTGLIVSLVYSSHYSRHGDYCSEQNMQSPCPHEVYIQVGEGGKKQIYIMSGSDSNNTYRILTMCQALF